MALFASHPAAARDRCLENVWHGTVGKAEVTMRFDESPDDAENLTGLYYYGSNLAELALLPVADQPGVWEERGPSGKITGVLRLACHGGQLRGQWSRPDGSGLQVFAAAKATSYRARQFEKLPLRIDKTVELDKRRRYQLIGVQGVPGLQGVRVLGDGPGIGRLNGELFKRFTDRLEIILECRMDGRIRNQEQSAIYASDILAYGPRFIVIGEYAESACGGVHPISGAGAWTWNLDTGAEEDVGKWLLEEWPWLPDTSSAPDSPGDPLDNREAGNADAADADSADPELQTALGRFIATRSTEQGKECRGKVTVKLDRQHVSPARTGLVVRPEADSYVTRWCAVTFTIPYELVWPYLTDRGKRNARSMKSSLPVTQSEDALPPGS